MGVTTTEPADVNIYHCGIIVFITSLRFTNKIFENVTTTCKAVTISSTGKITNGMADGRSKGFPD
jgi:hypothetical protein